PAGWGTACRGQRRARSRRRLNARTFTDRVLSDLGDTGAVVQSVLETVPPRVARSLMSGYEVEGQRAGSISVLVQSSVPSGGAVTAGASRDGKGLVRSVGGQTLERDLAVGQRDGKGTHDLDSRGD